MLPSHNDTREDLLWRALSEIFQGAEMSAVVTTVDILREMSEAIAHQISLVTFPGTEIGIHATGLVSKLLSESYGIELFIRPLASFSDDAGMQKLLMNYYRPEMIFPSVSSLPTDEQVDLLSGVGYEPPGGDMVLALFDPAEIAPSSCSTEEKRWELQSAFWGLMRYTFGYSIRTGWWVGS